MGRWHLSLTRKSHIVTLLAKKPGGSVVSGPGRGCLWKHPAKTLFAQPERTPAEAGGDGRGALDGGTVKILRLSFSSLASAAIAAIVLYIGSSILPAVAPTGAAQQPNPEIVRNTLLDTTVSLNAGTYHMVVAELNLDPRAETQLHIHPGPSV